LVRTKELRGRWIVENVGGGESRFIGTREELEVGLEGISRRCWNRSDLIY
jgi:hypothetical protein